MEGCGTFCSELHVCYSLPDTINIIVARKKITYVACSMHIVVKKVYKLRLENLNGKNHLGG